MQSNLKNIDTPVCPQKFLKQFTQKYRSWDDSVVTTKLQETWKQNCLAMNNVIAFKDDGLKFVISAPTGSAKTENTIIDILEETQERGIYTKNINLKVR